MPSEHGHENVSMPQNVNWVNNTLKHLWCRHTECLTSVLLPPLTSSGSEKTFFFCVKCPKWAHYGGGGIRMHDSSQNTTCQSLVLDRLSRSFSEFEFLVHISLARRVLYLTVRWRFTAFKLMDIFVTRRKICITNYNYCLKQFSVWWVFDETVETYVVYSC